MTPDRDLAGRITGIVDIRDRQRRIMMSPFAISEQGDGFKYGILDEAMEDLYSDLLADSKGTQRAAKISTYRTFAYSSYYGGYVRLEALADMEEHGVSLEPGLPPELAEALKDIRNHPLCSGKTLAEICRIYTRDGISFSLIPNGLGENATGNGHSGSHTPEQVREEVLMIDAAKAYRLIWKLRSAAEKGELARLGGILNHSQKEMLDAILLQISEDQRLRSLSREPETYEALREDLFLFTQDENLSVQVDDPKFPITSFGHMLDFLKKHPERVEKLLPPLKSAVP